MVTRKIGPLFPCRDVFTIDDALKVKDISPVLVQLGLAKLEDQFVLATLDSLVEFSGRHAEVNIVANSLVPLYSEFSVVASVIVDHKDENGVLFALVVFLIFLFLLILLLLLLVVNLFIGQAVRVLHLVVSGWLSPFNINVVVLVFSTQVSKHFIHKFLIDLLGISCLVLHIRVSWSGFRFIRGSLQCCLLWVRSLARRSCRLIFLGLLILLSIGLFFKHFEGGVLLQVDSDVDLGLLL